MKENTNIPKGYKQTKLGIIPEDWRVERIDNIFEFINTNSLSRSKLNYDVTENSIYNIHYGDIHATFTKPILDLDEENKIPVINTDVDISKLNFLNEGDLIIADASEDYDGVGKAIELKNVKQKKLVAGLHTFALRDITSKTSLGYRAYIFKNTKVSNKLKTIATGSKVYGISKSNLSKFEIVFPPLPEQKAIAKILSTWDKAIENYQLLIDKYKLKKKGLMQKLLTPKEGWKEVWLGEVFDMFAGKDMDKSKFKKKKSKEFIYPVYSNALTEKGLYGYYNSYQYEGNKITVTARGTLGNAQPRFENFNAIGRLLILIPKVKLNINFVSEYINNKLNIFIESTGVPQLTAPQFKVYKIYLPDLQTQTKIANILSSADKEINILEQQLSKLKEQKKGLMQVLLSGKKRVKVMDN